MAKSSNLRCFFTRWIYGRTKKKGWNSKLCRNRFDRRRNRWREKVRTL